MEGKIDAIPQAIAEAVAGLEQRLISWIDTKYSLQQVIPHHDWHNLLATGNLSQHSVMHLQCQL